LRGRARANERATDSRSLSHVAAAGLLVFACDNVADSHALAGRNGGAGIGAAQQHSAVAHLLALPVKTVSLEEAMNFFFFARWALQTEFAD